MLLRVALFLVMALGLAGFGTVAWISTRPPPAPPVVAHEITPPARVTVLAAARMLRAGTLLKPEDLVPQNVLASDAPAGSRPDTIEARADLFGAMLRRTLLPNQVIVPADVMRPGDHGFLAAVLAPGMRATSVAVDAVTGTAGLIWPGDHVDLILTETIDDQTAPLAHRVAGETVLRDVQVIAVDQELAHGTAPGSAPGAGSQSRTVTLEVTPPQAERVAVAARLGHLSLVVISAETLPPATPRAPRMREADADTGAVAAAIQPAADAPVQAPPGHADAGQPSSGHVPAPVDVAAPTPVTAAPVRPAVMRIEPSTVTTGRPGGPKPAVAAAPTPPAAAIPATPEAAAPSPTPATPDITWGGDVSAALNAGRKTDPGNTTLRVFEGSGDGKEFHF